MVTDLAELYRLCNSWRPLFRQKLPAHEVDDAVQDIWLTAFTADIRKPESIRAFVWTLAHRKVTRFPMRLAQPDPRTPDRRLSVLINLLRRERLEQVMCAMKNLTAQSAEIIYRFYFLEQTRKQIEAVMCLRPTQFRHLKSRAIGKLRENCKESKCV